MKKRFHNFLFYCDNGNIYWKIQWLFKILRKQCFNITVLVFQKMKIYLWFISGKMDAILWLKQTIFALFGWGLFISKAVLAKNEWMFIKIKENGNFVAFPFFSKEWNITCDLFLITWMSLHNWNRLLSHYLDVAYPFLPSNVLLKSSESVSKWKKTWLSLNFHAWM